MDRTDIAPLTSERRYGIFRTGLGAALILVFVLAAAGIALLLGVRNATILMSILLPLMLLSAVIANLWLWLLHRRAAKSRERAANEWVSTTLSRQYHPTSVPNTEDNSPSDPWIKRFSNRYSTPPPGYQSVETNND